MISSRYLIILLVHSLSNITNYFFLFRFITTNFIINILEKNNINIERIHFYKNYQIIFIKFNDKNFSFMCFNKNIKSTKKKCEYLFRFTLQDTFNEHKYLNFLIDE